MKALVVYDSRFGNTEKIARAIGGGISGDVRVLHAGEAKTSDLESVGFLIVGSPTQGFRSTKPVQAFIDSIPAGGLKGIDIAAFDTRMSAAEAGRGLRWLMNTGGYAAARIENALKKKGGTPALPPEGFFVKDREGPLKEGEEERAAEWVRTRKD